MEQTKKIELSRVVAKYIWPVYISPMELAQMNMATRLLQRMKQGKK